MFGILGSGFGLYAYLPALVDGCEQRIVLPARYRARLAERSELARFVNSVQWEADEAAALTCADGLVLALRPIDQGDWIDRCLTRSKIERLILEKPLAPSPDGSERILEDLIRSRRVFRIGYIFRYTAWAQKLLHVTNLTARSDSLSIRWEFMAHHFRYNLQSWKRFNATGGGAIRLYGIHVMALIAEIGYRDVIVSRAFGASPDEIEKWTAAFTGTGLPECDVAIDTRAIERQFRVGQVASAAGIWANVLANLSHPYESEDAAPQPGQTDQRVPMLIQLCRSLWKEDEDANRNEWYDATLKLWRSIEAKTTFEKTRP